jgi:hypothetical protein
MNGFVHLYYFLMVACFVVSLFYRRFALVKWLIALLFASIVTEALAEIIGTGHQKHFIVYHFYIPVEYTLVTLAMRSQITNQRLRKSMLFSIIAFWPASLYISFVLQNLTVFPGTAIGIEAVLVISWSLLTLVFIEPVSELSIFQLPVFWVALGFLIYFSGTVALNTVYNYLRDSSTAKALSLFDIINNISNCLLYIFLTIGIVCHKGQTKSLVR